jgi:ankyrin repeat protein
MEIKYNRNQYIRIDKSVEKISKMNIYIKNYYYNFTEKIEDLELEGDENMIIYRNEIGNGDEFINIYSGAKIMITTEKTINEDKYKKLPESVDYVIVDRLVYEVKDEFDMMKFKSEKRFREYIEEVERQGKINENNKNGETVLTIACKNEIASKNGMERVAMEIIPRMSDEAINKWNNKFGNTALILACYNKMERVALELIPRMSEEAINKWDEDGYTALIWTCKNRWERVAMELIPKMNKKAINKWNKDGRTALMIASKNKMERVKELINTINNK